MQSSHLFLYLNTGGGHLAPARAVASAMKQADPGSEAELADGLRDAPAFVRWLIVDGYKLMQANAQWVYAVVYFIHQFRWIRAISAALVSPFIEPFLERIILRERPRSIGIFHFLLIRPVRSIVRRHGLDCGVTVVVTDPYTAHPFWFSDPSEEFVVFSERLKRHCMRIGVPESNLTVLPQPVDERFSAPMSEVDRMAFKRSAGIPAGNSVVLLIGGGDGLPGAASIAARLLAACNDATVVAVCGRNRRLQTRLERLANELPHGRLIVHGYIPTVYEYVNCADTVVTKCGASTIMEILMAGKVPVISNYIWGQERGNMEHVVENGMGFYEPGPRRVSARVEALLRERESRELLQHWIRGHRITSGSDAIARHVLAAGAGRAHRHVRTPSHPRIPVPAVPGLPLPSAAA